ncbi:hypothetical protein QUF95_07090 [Paenibacillus silvae]|uniref:hypothetical protein n=1 Tax=Paenibacillus silvae TaxID=1325358 RepID=UPI0025A23750|nr:hypothetical protein [Paenibacillus silvae]MDM5277141.1 hypothetical protein [Paenibacillus silvae]
MNLLAETPFENSLGFDLSFSSVKDGFVKIFVSGELAAQSRDRRIFLRINGVTSSYQSFTLMNGHAGAGEWDTSGIYLGRNGWNLDSNFLSEIKLGIFSKSQKITANGLTTFALGDNRILGYEHHGFLVTSSPLSSISVGFDSGVASGKSSVYVM